MSDRVVKPAGRGFTPADMRSGATRKRAMRLALLFVTGVIDHLDRSNPSVAAGGWFYVVLQIPSGWLVDRLPPCFLYPAALLPWSVSTLCLGFSAGFATILFLRLLTGVLEAPSYPLKIASMPPVPRDRTRPRHRLHHVWPVRPPCFSDARAALAAAALRLGSVLTVPGGVGIVWAAIWFLIYRELGGFRGINRPEPALLEPGSRATIPASPRSAASGGKTGSTILGDLGAVLTRRKLIGLISASSA